MNMRTFRYYTESVGTNGIPTLYPQTAEGCPMPDGYYCDRPVYFGDVCLAGCDSYFEDACYADTLEDLDDNELYELTELYADYLCEKNLEHFGYWPE